MPPARTAAAARSREVRLERRRCAFPALLGLAAYLTVFVTAPAWHHHAGHDHAAHGHAGEEETGNDRPAVAAKSACGHHHHDHGPAADDEPRSPGEPGGDGHDQGDGHDCRLCELLAQCPLPVAPPAVADAGEPLPPVAAAVPPGQRAISFGAWDARGPPRV